MNTTPHKFKMANIQCELFLISIKVHIWTSASSLGTSQALVVDAPTVWRIVVVVGDQWSWIIHSLALLGRLE